MFSQSGVASPSLSYTRHGKDSSRLSNDDEAQIIRTSAA
jgi:hypothetical protein